MNAFETQRTFLKQLGLLVGAAALASCRPENLIPAEFPTGLVQINPQETFLSIPFGFDNLMTDYSVRIDFDTLSRVINRYHIPTGFADNNKIMVELLPEVFDGEESKGVLVQPKTLGTERISISGGLFVQSVTDATGHTPSDLRDQTFLSNILSVKLVGGFALLAEHRGDILKGTAKTIEKQYAVDVDNLSELFVAGMQILSPTTPIEGQNT